MDVAGSDARLRVLLDAGGEVVWVTAPIRDYPDLVQALRSRRDALNISHETIDSISGLQPGYTSKLLAPKPIKNLGPMSLGSLLGALGLKLVAVEDMEQTERVSARWQKRKRPQKIVVGPLLASALSITENRLEYMRKIGSKGGKMGGSKGGKRRLKTMKKRARQAVASHAARMRWAKQKAG